MKSKLWSGIAFCLVSIAMLSLFVSCAAPANEAAPSLIEITDQLGRTVKLDRTPQRIISLAPSNTEILFALGLADKVVAVTNLCDYPPEAKEKPNIGGFTTTNIEKVIALSPDLVLATSIHEKTIIPQLEQKGLAVLASDGFESLQGRYAKYNSKLLIIQSSGKKEDKIAINVEEQLNKIIQRKSQAI